MVYAVVRGKYNNDEVVDIYNIKIGLNEFNTIKNMNNNYKEIVQIFFFKTRKEAESVKRAIDECIKKGGE